MIRQRSLSGQIRPQAGKEIVLAAAHPNAGLEALYRKKLDALIEEMNNSILYWVGAAYRQNAPEALAMDRSPAATLNALIGRLRRRWQRRFDQLAPDLASYFAKTATERSDGALQAILRKGGMTVQFKMTATVNDALQAVLAENVGLIKSIASEHMTDVQGIVMRSVAAGRDLGTMSKEIQAKYGVTKRRAAFISRDQNNKTTAVITKTRQIELGLEAEWMHSRAGRHPRPSHVAANGKRYDPAKGAYIDGKWIYPGQEPNCRCVSRSVLPRLN